MGKLYVYVPKFSSDNVNTCVRMVRAMALEATATKDAIAEAKRCGFPAPIFGPVERPQQDAQSRVRLH